MSEKERERSNVETNNKRRETERFSKDKKKMWEKGTKDTEIVKQSVVSKNCDTVSFRD
jgi:hypothetical protein